MKGAVLGAKVTAMIPALFSGPAPPMPKRECRNRIPRSTADPNRQRHQPAQSGKPIEVGEPKQGKSAEPSSAKAKALRRSYAIGARIQQHKAEIETAVAQSQKATRQIETTADQSKKETGRAKLARPDSRERVSGALSPTCPAGAWYSAGPLADMGLSLD